MLKRKLAAVLALTLAFTGAGIIPGGMDVVRAETGEPTGSIKEQAEQHINAESAEELPAKTIVEGVTKHDNPVFSERLIVFVLV